MKCKVTSFVENYTYNENFCRCPNGRTWEEHFIHWYKDMGTYINCYSSIKQSWDKITAYFKTNCPLIYETIKGTSMVVMFISKLKFLVLLFTFF